KPWLAVLFAVPALSLAGVPPLSGFFAKLALVRGGLEAEQYVIVGVSLAVSIFTLYYMNKIWEEVFWKDPPEPAAEESPQPVDRAGAAAARAHPAMITPLALMAAMSVVIGLGAEPVFRLSMEAAEQLLDTREYIA